MDYGYLIVPSQSDKDEEGRLLNDPFDPRCTEWLVEIPTEVSWANHPVLMLSTSTALVRWRNSISTCKCSGITPPTSATIEFREHEIEPLADAASSHGEGRGLHPQQLF